MFLQRLSKLGMTGFNSVSCWIFAQNLLKLVNLFREKSTLTDIRAIMKDMLTYLKCSKELEQFCDELEKMNSIRLEIYFFSTEEIILS